MNQTTFDQSRDTGIKLKEEGKLGEAMENYEHALTLAMTDQERSQIWQLIIHIHTDRLIKAADELANCVGYPVYWPWGANCVPSNYKAPPRNEVLK